MARLNAIRKIALYINNKNMELADAYGAVPMHDTNYPMVEKKLCVETYAKSNSMKFSEANSILTEALELKFIRYRQDYGNYQRMGGDDFQLELYPPKGSNLIQKRYGIPTGYFREVLAENMVIYTFLGIFLGTITGTVIAILALLMDKT